MAKESTYRIPGCARFSMPSGVTDMNKKGVTRMDKKKGVEVADMDHIKPDYEGIFHLTPDQALHVRGALGLYMIPVNRAAQDEDHANRRDKTPPKAEPQFPAARFTVNQDPKVKELLTLTFAPAEGTKERALIWLGLTPEGLKEKLTEMKVDPESKEIRRADKEPISEEALKAGDVIGA